MAEDRRFRPTVLVVEDDAAIRMLLVQALGALRLYAMTAADGAAGLEMVRRIRPDLLVVDVNMPRMGGVDMLDALRTEGHGDIPSLVISALGRPSTVPEESFMAKPFEIDDFLGAVERTLAHDGLSVELVD